MLSIQKKLVVDEQGQPQAMIISCEQYQHIIEMPGLDLNEDDRPEVDPPARA